jgi:hypothetical protein
MAEGRSRQAWEHTSALLSMLANVNRNPKKRSKPFSPAEFNPFGQRRRHTGPKLRMRDVKDMVIRTPKKKSATETRRARSKNLS